MTAATVAPSWSTEVPDWKDRILNRRKMVPDLPLFKPVAEKALRVFKRLRIPDIHGTPTFGEVSEQWVFDLVSAVFGAYDPETRSPDDQRDFPPDPEEEHEDDDCGRDRSDGDDPE